MSAQPRQLLFVLGHFVVYNFQLRLQWLLHSDIINLYLHGCFFCVKLILYFPFNNLHFKCPLLLQLLLRHPLYLKPNHLRRVTQWLRQFMQPLLLLQVNFLIKFFWFKSLISFYFQLILQEVYHFLHFIAFWKSHFYSYLSLYLKIYHRVLNAEHPFHSLYELFQLFLIYLLSLLIWRYSLFRFAYLHFNHMLTF